MKVARLLIVLAVCLARCALRVTQRNPDAYYIATVNTVPQPVKMGRGKISAKVQQAAEGKRAAPSLADFSWAVCTVLSCTGHVVQNELVQPH